MIEASDPHAAWSTMQTRTVLYVFLYGLLIGIVTFALYLAFERFVFEAILCQDTVALARCESSDEYGAGVALIIGSMLGLVLLVRERVYRPILAILGVIVTLWSVFTLIGNLPLILAVAVVAILFGLAYVLFSWLVQPTSLVISVVGVIVVSVLARLAIGL